MEELSFAKQMTMAVSLVQKKSTPMVFWLSQRSSVKQLRAGLYRLL